MKKVFIYIATPLIFITCKKETVIDDEIVNNPEIEESITLDGFIGLSQEPSPGDSVCPIPFYLSNNFDTNAIPIGNQAKDFTLYNKNGEATNLKNIIESSNKPVFIMMGSYTCPRFRESVPGLNQLIQDYGNEMNFYVSYNVEAHPTEVFSPYREQIWITQDNMDAGILYTQPRTYQDRIDLVNALVDSMQIDCDILIDGPCNEFWLEYGEAPNRAYVIDENGTVQISHGWFDYPSMDQSIISLLEN